MVVGGARVDVSGDKKKAFDRGGLFWPPRANAKEVEQCREKKTFDRGGPVWPPRSNAADDRLGGGLGGALPPQPKTGGSGEALLPQHRCPPAKIRGEMDFFWKILNFEQKF